ncbi:MAG: tetratricopeptide repeat protein [Armatimonadetes bacterium]|nr:tetratricopeptide repeat protein [Armatimonadota bacterium]
MTCCRELAGMRLLTLLLLLAWAWSATALTQVRLGAAPAPMRLISPGLSLDEVGPPFPGDVAPGVEEADRMRREGRFMEASQALREVLKGNPLDATALAILGQTEMRLGQVEEGERLCREALRIAPGSSRLLNRLGHAMAAAGRLEAAETAFRESVRRNSKSYAALMALSSLQFKGNPQAARALIEQMLELHPYDNYAYTVLARFYVEDGKPEDVVRLYRFYLRSPTVDVRGRALVRLALAHQLLLLRRPAEAEAEARSLIADLQSDRGPLQTIVARAWMLVGDTRWRVGDLKGALAVYRTAPESPDVATIPRRDSRRDRRSGRPGPERLAGRERAGGFIADGEKTGGRDRAACRA